MKVIPLKRFREGLFLSAKINGSFCTEFELDTGCSGTVISKEVAELLYFCGKLKDEDITGYETSNWGNHYQTRTPSIVIKKLTFGRFSISDIKATICNRYGGPNLFGMSCLDKLKDYTITPSGIIVDDGKKEVKTVGLKQAKDVKHWCLYCHNKLKKLREFREKHPEQNYKFDYKDWCLPIFSTIGKCYNPLYEKNKYKKVIPILEDLRSLIHKNLEYDEEHPNERGSFLTGYFNFYLATAYFQADRKQESIDYYEKAKPFFMKGTATRQEIEDQIAKIKKQIEKEATEESTEDKPELVPTRTMDFEGDIKLLGLTSVEICDNVYGKNEKKSVYIGFKDFNTAFDFSITYHKRLEIIKKIDGVWNRTGDVAIDDLTACDLNLGEKYFLCNFKSDIENRLKEITESHDASDSEFFNLVEQNKAKAFEAIKPIQGKYLFEDYIILKKNDLSLDAFIQHGASLRWHDTELTICAMDVDDSIAKNLADDVLAGKFIPCAIGQMPEDFLFLYETHKYFRTCNEDDYIGNNNPDLYKWIVDDFVVLDKEKMVGYCYRATYDNIHWRWQGGHHSDQSNLLESCKDINKNEDYKFCYWQLVRTKNTEYTSFISPKPY